MMRRGFSDVGVSLTAPVRRRAPNMNFKDNTTRRLTTAAFRSSALLCERFGLQPSTSLMSPAVAPLCAAQRPTATVPMMRSWTAPQNAHTHSATSDRDDVTAYDDVASEIMAIKNEDFQRRPDWLPPPLTAGHEVESLIDSFRHLCFPEFFHNAMKPCSSTTESLDHSSSSSSSSSSETSSPPSSKAVDHVVIKTQLRRFTAIAKSMTEAGLVIEALDGGLASSVSDADVYQPALRSSSDCLSSREAALSAAELYWKKSIEPHFIRHLPRLIAEINADVAATLRQDVATTSRVEIVLTYPVIVALLHYRLANALLRAGGPMLVSRLISERGHCLTGVDIHPGASIGPGCFIDHGTGLVIGGTSEIGSNVCLFHGVTLGAKGFPVDASGRRIKHMKRHPILKDNVSIYAGATVLGRITVGKGAVVAAGATVTKDVDPGLTVGVSKAPSAPKPTTI